MRPLDPMQIARVRQIIAEAKSVDPDDDLLVLDCLEAETDLLDIVDQLLSQRMECLCFQGAMLRLADDYREKAELWETRAERIKDMLAGIRDVVGQNIKRPGGNVIVSERKPDVERAPDFSVDALPDDLVRIKREADMAAIKAAVKAGRNVPGVQIGNPKRVVTIK